jgi:hypothetical protein
MASMLLKKELDRLSKKEIEKHLKEEGHEEKYIRETEFYLMVRFTDDYHSEYEKTIKSNPLLRNIPAASLYFNQLAELANSIKTFESVTGIELNVPDQYKALFSPEIEYYKMTISDPDADFLTAVRRKKSLAEFTIYAGQKRIGYYDAETRVITKLIWDGCTLENLQSLTNFMDRLNNEIPENLKPQSSN